MPNNAFKSAAGTEVTSDIIFLQKRENELDIEPEWVNLNSNGEGLSINSYFINNPEMILGNMEMVSTAYGFDSACLSNGEPLEIQLERAVKNIKGTLNIQKGAIESVNENSNDLPPYAEYKIGAYAIIDNKLYQKQIDKMEYIKCSEASINQYKGLIAVRDACQNTIDIQANGASDADVLLSQEKLNKVYDDFVLKYGRINDKKNNKLFKEDPSYPLLTTLEKYKDGKFERKADIFYIRTIRPNKTVTSVKTADDALMVSLSAKGRIDMEYMKQLSGFDEERIVSDLDGVIFRVPDIINTDDVYYVTADEYLSGNVKEKLNFAKMYSGVKKEEWIKSNIQYLEQVQPEPIKASKIKLRLGSTWIPESIIDDFIYEKFNVGYNSRRYLHAVYNDTLGSWNIEGHSWESYSVAAKTTYGTKRVNGYKLLEDALNLKNTVVKDRIEEDGKEKYVVNDKETRLAQGKQKLLKQEFDNWIWKNPERRNKLEELYNNKFNSYVNRKYDGSHLEFNGMNCNISLRPHQKNAIARGLYGGNALFAHCVGAGKTYEMIALAMESKRRGLCKKSMFVVPNNIISQFSKEFLELYPQANVLIATEKDFSTINRKKFCSKIATGDYDAVIIGHSQFERIPLSAENQKELIKEQLDEILQSIEDTKRSGNYITVKQLERSRKSIETRLKKINDIEQDDVITFEQLGVDKLFIDEAHNYKNLYMYTKMTNIAGVNTTEAKKSTDMYNKIRWLNKQPYSSGVVFATGTPVSNTMAELYTMQRYLQPERLKELGLEHFDAWASTFGETVQELELKPEGSGFRIKERFAKFYNIPELMSIFREVADIQTADMLDLPVPKCNFENISCTASDVQKDLVQEFGERADRVRDGSVTPDEDNMLKIVSDGRKLALDQRIIDSAFEDYADSKVNNCVENVYKIWSNTSDEKLTQFIFCDLSTPNSKQFNVYDDIKQKLIMRGIPEEEIAFIHDANTNAQKEVLFLKVRSGSIRVMIGSTQKCGTGTNAQNKLIAIHDLDCPWRPADLEQRLGRIVRQGNSNNEVWCYRYVTEGTFDAYSWQTVEKKQHFISQIMNGDTTIRELEDLDSSSLNYAKLKALAVHDPLIQEKMELELQVKDLMLQKNNHQSQIFDLQDNINYILPKKISASKALIHSYKNDIKAINNAVDDYVYIKNFKLSNPKEIGLAVKTSSNAIGDNESIVIGEYKGLQIRLRIDDFSDKIILNLGQSAIECRLGIDALTNGTKLLSSLNDINDLLNAEKANLELLENNLSAAKSSVQKEFPLENELEQKQKRLEELNLIFDDKKKSDNQKVQTNEYIR